MPLNYKKDQNLNIIESGKTFYSETGGRYAYLYHFVSIAKSFDF